MSRVRGLLTQSGEWQCECNPRLPAIWLEVKKNNQNKGRHFYTCQKPQEERCGFFLWDTDAEKREKAQFGETLTARRGSIAEPGVVPPVREVEAPKEVVVPPSKQPPVQRLYPRLPPAEDDEFEYFETPSKTRPQTRGKPPPVDEEIYDWEDSDEDIAYKKSFARRISPPKRPHFEVESIEDLDYSPPPSPKKPKTLSDPFTTPPKQIFSTPHTPPETRPAQNTPRINLLPLSYSLLHQLSPHSVTLGSTLWQSVREHLLRCGRVADGAVKGRDAARAVSKEKDIRINELERQIRILKAQREVDKAVIGALKRNVDVQWTD